MSRRLFRKMKKQESATNPIILYVGNGTSLLQLIVR